MLEKLFQNKNKKGKLVLEIPISVVEISKNRPALQLKKVISDPENIKYFIDNCLKNDSIEATIVLKDKFKTKVRLNEFGYKVEE